jgi:formylmethanofuran--tetrahydromethanopterin N-formyltransferase
MRIHSTEVIDTFAEAFEMWAARVLITAYSREWALAAAHSMTGFATSVIGCKCEAGIESEIPQAQTPDRRPGVSVLLFATSSDSVGKRLLERIGQSVMTCPTTACYNGLEVAETVSVGGKLRYFGDGYQMSKRLKGRRYWRIPVMEGEFLVEDRFGVQAAVGGGNLLILGEHMPATLRATEAAVQAMREVRGVILPFPNGIVRSGSKPGSRYKGLPASTNDAYCPSLRAVVPKTQISQTIGCVFEIVIDGLDLAAVEEAMRHGARAAAEHGAVQISAGNYGGHLGKYQIGLYKLFSD